ncbi:MAG: phage portal protein [Pseudomonadota bacterium]
MKNGLLARVFGRRRENQDSRPKAQTFTLSSPEFFEAVALGASSGTVTAQTALKNTSVMRSVQLLSGVIGRIPSTIKRRTGDGGVEAAADHPLYVLFMHQPNDWQDVHKFKSLMQLWLLLHGNAYAQIVRSGRRVIALNPIHPARVLVEQAPDFSLTYQVTSGDRQTVKLGARDVLHLRGISEDGITGISPVKMAADVINSHIKATRAAERNFTNGMMVGGFLQMPENAERLSEDAFKRLKQQMEEKYSGPENAGKWPILESGLQANVINSTAVDAQLVEYSSALVEDIGRVFGVPRPLLGVDDTSWGSGVEQLAILFVRFTLATIFDSWEQAVKVALIPKDEWDTVFLDFDERELLRGTIKEQFEAFAKAAGAGGHQPWMEANEIREQMNMGAHPDGSGLKRSGKVDDE